MNSLKLSDGTGLFLNNPSTSFVQWLNRIFKIFVLVCISNIASHAQSTSAKPFVAVANHVGLSVIHLDQQKEWYERAFNMREEQHFEIPDMKVRTVLLRAPNGLGIELIEVAGANPRRNYKDALDAARELGYGHWAIVVNNLKEAYNHLIGQGAVSVSAPGPAVQPGASFAYVKDPEGNLIEMMQLPGK